MTNDHLGFTRDVAPATRDAQSITLGIIADDITGALDTGVQFAEAGLGTALLLDLGRAGPGRDLPDQTQPVQVLSTDSRDQDAVTARQRAAQAAERLRGRRLYKKIDSTMRGHVGPEIEAVLQTVARQTAGMARAIVCPAVIGQGRTIREGRLWVGDTLLHESDFCQDPIWPARTSDLRELLGAPSSHLSLDTVRAGPETLAQAILDAPTAIVTVDAVERADIECTAQAAALSRCLPCGALGLARAWIECLIAEGLVGTGRIEDTQPATRRARPTPGTRPIIVVAGSRHPVTRAQLRHAVNERGLARVEAGETTVEELARRWTAIAGALAGGKSVVVHSPLQEIQDAGTRRAVSDAMAGWVQRACGEFVLGGIVLTGGETALAVCQALGATGIDILGELETGIPWGRLIGGIAPGMQVVTKAGGFGRPDSLLHVVEALQKGTKH